MARNGSGVYSLPAGYEATTGETAEATQHNSPLEDLASDANIARPVVAGGTGATTASGARTNLGVSSSVVSKSSNYTAVSADRGKVFSTTASLTLSLTAAATLGNGWFVDVVNNSGTLTIDPDGSETISGSSTLTVSDGSSLRIYCDGSAFYAGFFSNNDDYEALTSLDDLDSVSDGVYGWEASAPTNAPFDYGFASQLTLSGGDIFQIAWGGSGKDVAVRRYTSSAWGSWETSLTESNAPELSEAQVTDATDTTFGRASGQRLSQAASFHSGIKGVTDYTSDLTAYDLAGDAPTGATHADIYLTGSGASGGNIEWGGSAATVVKFNVPLTQLGSVTTSIGTAVDGDASAGVIGNDSTYSDGTISLTAKGGQIETSYKTEAGPGAATDQDLVYYGGPYITGHWGGPGAYGSGGAAGGAGNFSGAGVLRVFWR